VAETVARYNAVFELLTNSKQAGKDIDKVKKKAKGLNAAFEVAKGTFAGIVAVQAVEKAVSGLGRLLSKSVQLATQFEQMAVSYKVFTGSVAESKKVLKEIEKFSSVTPFQQSELQEVGKQLLSFGTNVKDLLPDLKALGGVSAATGKDLGRIGLIFGQVQAKGKLMGEELLQFREAGIPVGDILATIGKNAGDANISFDDLRKGFRKITGEGGKFEDAIADQAKTLGGLKSTIDDLVNNSLRNLGRVFLPVLKEVSKTIIKLLTPVNDKLSELSETDFGIKLAAEFKATEAVISAWSNNIGIRISNVKLGLGGLAQAIKLAVTGNARLISALDAPIEKAQEKLREGLVDVDEIYKGAFEKAFEELKDSIDSGEAGTVIDDVITSIKSKFKAQKLVDVEDWTNILGLDVSGQSEVSDDVAEAMFSWIKKGAELIQESKPSDFFEGDLVDVDEWTNAFSISKPSDKPDEPSFFEKLFDLEGDEGEKFEKLLQDGLNSLKTFAAERARMYDDDITQQKTRVDKANKIAEDGNVKQLEIEEARLEELQSKREKAVQQQRALAAIELSINNALAASKTAVGIADAIKAGFPAALLAVPLMIGLISQVGGSILAINNAFSAVPGFAEGTDYVHGPGTGKSDSIIARLSKGERVVDSETNSKMAGVSNSMLPEAVDLYKNAPRIKKDIIIEMNRYRRDDLQEMRSMNTKLELLVDAFENSKTNVRFDKEGFAYSQIRLKEKMLKRKRYIA